MTLFSFDRVFLSSVKPLRSVNYFLHIYVLLALCGPLLECLLPWMKELITKELQAILSLWKCKGSTFSLNMELSSTVLLWRSFLPCALQHVRCQLSRNNSSISMESSVYHLLLLLYSVWALVEGGGLFISISLQAGKVICNVSKLYRTPHCVTSCVTLLNILP